MALLLQERRRAHLKTRLCGVHANGAASSGLLLRARQRCVYAGSKRGDCPAAKELFDARYWDAHRTRPTRTAYALSGQDKAVSSFRV